MATQAVINDLTQVIQDCLTRRMQKGFDANAALTLNIARELAKDLEARATKYTDDEITKVKDLISGEVDLTPFTEFMAMIKDMLDGDEDTEGFQVFNALVADTVANKQAIITHTSSITLITSTLETMQTTLNDHERRLADLENADNRGGDCESCHDGLLNIIKESHEAACAAAAQTIDTYQNTRAAALATQFADERDPVAITVELAVKPSGKLAVSGTVDGRRPAAITALYNDGTAAVAAVIGKAKEFAVESASPASSLAGPVKVQAKDADGLSVGPQVTVNWVNPEVQDSGDTDGGSGDGAVL